MATRGRWARRPFRLERPAAGLGGSRGGHGPACVSETQADPTTRHVGGAPAHVSLRPRLAHCISWSQCSWCPRCAWLISTGGGLPWTRAATAGSSRPPHHLPTRPSLLSMLTSCFVAICVVLSEVGGLCVDTLSSRLPVAGLQARPRPDHPASPMGEPRCGACPGSELASSRAEGPAPGADHDGCTISKPSLPTAYSCAPTAAGGRRRAAPVGV